MLYLMPVPPFSAPPFICALAQLTVALLLVSFITRLIDFELALAIVGNNNIKHKASIDNSIDLECFMFNFPPILIISITTLPPIINKL